MMKEETERIIEETDGMTQQQKTNHSDAKKTVDKQPEVRSSTPGKQEIKNTEPKQQELMTLYSEQPKLNIKPEQPELERTQIKQKDQSQT